MACEQKGVTNMDHMEAAFERNMYEDWFLPTRRLDIKGGTKDRETETMPRGADTKNDCPELEVY